MHTPRPHHVALTGYASPHEPRPWSQIEQELNASRHGIAYVLLGGGEPTRSPLLLQAIRRTRDLGAKPVLVTDGRALASRERLDKLLSAGLEEVCIRLASPEPSEHDEQAFRLALKTLDLISTIRPLHATLLCEARRHAATSAKAWVALAERSQASLRLVGHLGEESYTPLAPSAVESDWMDALWKAAAASETQMRVTGVLTAARAPADQPSDTPLPLAGPQLLDATTRGWTPNIARRGVHAVIADDASCRDVLHHLAAVGAPAVNAPVCLHGTGTDQPEDVLFQAPCTPCPAKVTCAGVTETLAQYVQPRATWQPLPDGATVQVLQPLRTDRLQVLSTLAALTQHLRQLGLNAALHTAWDCTFDPEDVTAPLRHPTHKRMAWQAWRFLTRRRTPLDLYLPPPLKLGHPLRYDEPPHRARAVDRRFYEDLDFSETDLVVVPGFGGAAAVLSHPTLPPTSRVLVLDFHMLDGVERLAERYRAPDKRLVEGGWWPSERVFIHSCFPRYAHLYRARGVPLAQIHWRPYPLFSGHFSEGGPPEEAAFIFSGGRHFRDYATLVEAARDLSNEYPIEVHADTSPTLQAVGPLVLRGTTPLPDYYEAIRKSRFVVLPLHHDPTRAAGISAVSMAFMAGRPVIATRSGGIEDHVRDGVDGLLVPPRDAAALAEAIDRLTQDDVLLRRLSDGARESARLISARAWASEIAFGTVPRGPSRQEDGTWRSW